MDLASEISNDASNLMKSDYLDCEDSYLVSGESNDKSCVNDGDSEKMFGPSIKNCYCGNERNLNVVELQCLKCLKWFHQQCISIHFGKLVPFLTSYIFCCKNCSANKIESFKRTQTNFYQICQTALANLTHQQQRNSKEEKIGFSKDREIIPFIDKHWDILSNKQKPSKNTWHSSVFKIMIKDDTFVSDTRDPDNVLFGLRSRELEKIAPNYDNLKNLKEQNGGPNASININSRSLRGVKKRLNQSEVSGDLTHPNKKPKSELDFPPLPPSGFPAEFPYNKDGFRYFLAESDPHSPHRQEYDARPDNSGKPIPCWLCRRLLPEKMLLSMHDRSHYLKVMEDRKTVIGEKGYCSIRASLGVSKGTWYYEVKINEKPSNSATRIGWAQEMAHLFAPIGCDMFGYSWRSRKGTKFHDSIGKHYADEGFDVGDILGCLIHLPHENDPTYETPLLPKTYKDKALLKFKSYLYFEEKDEPKKKVEKTLEPLEGSKIVFYKNGVKIGTAFENIYRGMYYPAAGLYKNISISFNFGPDLAYPPIDDEYRSKYRPMSDFIFETTIEHIIADMIFLVENESKISIETFYNTC